MGYRFGPDYPDETYVPHGYPEHTIDLGEVVMNYAVTGPEDGPAVLLIPGQTESWWGYEAAMSRLQDRFRVYAVDLRGQGRTTWTPGRYTLDTIGNDLVRFLLLAVKRPAAISGASSGGVLAAWLSAYAPPGLVRGALCEDPPLFACEVSPACGHSARQFAGPAFALNAKYLGEQWSIGDWRGLVAALQRMLPPGAGPPWLTDDAPPQNMKEYDPGWGKAIELGTLCAGCDHERMLGAVKVPMLLTHHVRVPNEETGAVFGALSDLQAKRVRALVEGAGQRCDYQSFPEMAHQMHAVDPAKFATVFREWVATLD